MEKDPNQTLEQARKGDPESISDLFAQYRPMLTRAVSLSYSGLQDAGYSMEDLLQEASIAFTRAIRGYDPGRGVTFGAYARRCVRNRLASVARSTASKRKKTSTPHQPSPEGTPLIAKEQLLHLERSLTEYERRVFRLMTDGYKPAEIAHSVDRDVKSVYNAICRIKSKAARHLTGD